MKKRVILKLFSFISVFSILFNLFYAPLYVLAQETGSQTDQSTPAPTLAVETDQTPEATSTPEPNQTPEATSTPESTPTPEEVSTPTATPTSEPTIEPTPTLLPGPEVVLGQVTENSPIPTIVTKPSLDSDKVNGKIEVLVLEDTNAQSVEETDFIDLEYKDTISAALATDKYDYAPTDTVVITGSGFTPNTVYEIVITSETGNFRFSDTVTSDESGNLFYTYQLDGNYRPIYKVEVRYLSGFVVKEAYFTDTDNNPGSCKGKNAECNINESGKQCCSGLICLPFVGNSGNGKCVEIKPVPFCVPGSAWAAEVVSASQGTLNNGSPIADPNRIDSSKSLGINDGNFYSLGKGGSLVLSFVGYVTNQLGADLYFYEVTWGRQNYSLEKAKVEVSQNAINWYFVGEVSNEAGFVGSDGISEIDFSSTGLSWIKYVRLTDATDFIGAEPTADGYDLDAVKAINQVCQQPGPEPVCGNGVKEGNEMCDGTDGVTPGENFCTKKCTLVPIYDGEQSCPARTVKSQTPILSKVISATDPGGETFNLDIGGKYIFEVSGTYSYDKNNSGKLADAAYGTKDNWSSTRTDIGIWGTNKGVTSLLADFGDGVGVVEWDNDTTFNSNHVYQKYYSPTKGSVQFLISDWYDSWFNSPYNNQSAMSDNSGSLTLNVYKCEPVSEVKICKYDNNQNLLSGWRVYLLGEKLNSFSIPSDGSVVNVGNYPSGDYALIASGVYNYGDSRMNADAANSYRYVGLPCAGSTDGWVNGEASSCMNNYLSLNFSTSGRPTAPGWGLYYNPEHIYAKAFTGGNLQAKIWDTCSLSQPEGCYGDNEGELKLDVYKGYVGDTGNDGCVTFNNVPYGSYQLDEVLKEGWRKESGQGEVVVDSSSEVFSLINALNYGSISGKKYEGSEEGTVLSGWSIVLTGNSPVSSLEVPANGMIVNSPSLDSGKKYLVKVYGTAQAGDNIHFDAECASDGGGMPWINGVPRYLSYGENLLDLKINDSFVDWGSCEPVNHTYYYLLNGNGSPVSFKVYDIYYPNNTGSLTVEIYEVVKEDVTDSSGYGWNDVLAGDYQLCEIIQTGWNQTKPGTFGAPTCYSVKVTPGSNQTFDFVNFKLGTIQGRKYEDLNSNGSRNSGEPYLNGWTVRLYKEGEVWDLVDLKTTGHTGVLGEYKFENLEPGRYKVCEVLKDGWVQTSPTGVTNNIDSDEAPRCRIVNIKTSGRISKGNNFGNFRLGKIYGYKYDEGGETGIEGWKIFIDNDGDKNFDEGEVSVQTGNDGYFEFTGLTSGTYNVCEVEQSGWQRMYPVGTNCQSIDIKSGSEKEIYFQNRKVVLGLTLTKLNDAVLGLSAGGQINYKLLIKNTGNQSLSGVTIKDAPAGGFTFVAGSGFLDSDSITPTFSGGYIEWYIGVLGAGEEKTLTYKLQTNSSLVNGVYPNIAIATGIYTPSEYVPEEVVGIFSPIVVEAQAVDNGAEEGQRIESNEGTPVNSEVRIASSLSYSTGVGSTGQVLGASTEVEGQVLPAAGSSTWNLALALLSLIFGFGLKALGIAVERGKIDTRRVRRGLKKASLFLSSLALFLVLVSTTKAFSDYVYITKLDSYLNKENFYLSYSALSESSISAQFYVRKDGDATWRTLGGVINSASGQVEVKPSDIYGGDGKYFFKVVINGGTASDETSTTIDRSGPDPVRDYRKEKISDGHYKLHWRNPDNIDFDKVKIYRSENTNFTADSSTEVGTVWGTAGSEMTWENAAAPGKEYYFAIRAIDKAGNASSVVADPETQVVAGAVLGESTEAPKTEEVKILPKEKKGEVLGEEESGKEETTVESTPSPESESGQVGGVLGQAVKFVKEKTKLTLFIAFLLGLASYFASKIFLKRKS